MHRPDGFGAARLLVAVTGCGCALLLSGAPASITGAHTIPTAKMAGPIILDIFGTPV
jgi:hypothetical protein